jgi:hypothetical protein
MTAMTNSKPALKAVSVLALAVAAVLAQSGPAQAQGLGAVDRAHGFLRGAARGQDVLGYVHFGYTYRGHTYVGRGNVTDRFGKLVPGHFNLAYDFRWGDGGETRVFFLCNARGDVYEVQTGRSNAGLLNQPFALANLSVQVVGNVLLAALKDDLNADQKRDLQRFVDNADAKGLLQLNLALKQALGR